MAPLLLLPLRRDMEDLLAVATTAMHQLMTMIEVPTRAGRPPLARQRRPVTVRIALLHVTSKPLKHIESLFQTIIEVLRACPLACDACSLNTAGAK